MSAPRVCETDNGKSSYLPYRIGEYVLLNPDPTPFMENFALIIDEESGLPMVSVKVVVAPETFNLAVDMSRPDSAVVIGYGRYMGDRIDVLTN